MALHAYTRNQSVKTVDFFVHGLTLFWLHIWKTRTRTKYVISFSEVLNIQQFGLRCLELVSLIMNKILCFVRICSICVCHEESSAWSPVRKSTNGVHSIGRFDDWLKCYHKKPPGHRQSAIHMSIWSRYEIRLSVINTGWEVENIRKPISQSIYIRKWGKFTCSKKPQLT